MVIKREKPMKISKQRKSPLVKAISLDSITKFNESQKQLKYQHLVENLRCLHKTHSPFFKVFKGHVSVRYECMRHTMTVSVYRLNVFCIADHNQFALPKKIYKNKMNEK